MAPAGTGEKGSFHQTVKWEAMMHAPAQTARPKQYYRQTNDGRGYYPEFKNLLDKELVLWWIRNDGTWKRMDTMAPNVARLNNGWSVYPGSGCWVAKDGEEEMLRLSSTKVADYGFAVGEMESEDWEPGQEIFPIATALAYMTYGGSSRRPEQQIDGAGGDDIAIAVIIRCS